MVAKPHKWEWEMDTCLGIVLRLHQSALYIDLEERYNTIMYK